MRHFQCILCALFLTGCTALPGPVSLSTESDGTETGSQASATESLPPQRALPSSTSIDVPFNPQAPFANWDELHEESCEEMSLLMVHHFLEGSAFSSREQADSEILELVAWEAAHGYSQDVTVEQLAQIARDRFGYKARIITDVSEESIRTEIAAGNPVLVPAAGRMLGNPYFSGEGPYYHMLVITGYNSWWIVTNDPGTKRGEGYRYRPAVLLDAIHDWTGVKEETSKGRKVMLVVTK